MLFGKKNFVLLLLSMALLIMGYFLMSGSTDIMSPVKISLAPVIVVSGYVLGVVSILVKK